MFHLFRVPRKFGEEREGGCQDFPLKTFCLTVSKISIGQTLTAATFSGIKKVWIREGGGSSKIFRRKLFVSQ